MDLVTSLIYLVTALVTAGSALVVLKKRDRCYSSVPTEK